MKTPTKQRSIQFGKDHLQYELVYSKRRTMAIQVYSDGRVVVRAPSGSAVDKVDAFILQKAKWILRHLKRFKDSGQTPAAPRRYVNGDVFHYLGQPYVLQIEKGSREHVELSEGILRVTHETPDDRQHIARLIDKWYRRQAARLLPQRLAACFPRVASWGVAYPPLTIRQMKSRWGSCRSTGKITLNLRLMLVDIDLIDYIILHELCHLREMNHSRAFYALMDSVLPDWREKRARLKKTPTF